MTTKRRWLSLGTALAAVVGVAALAVFLLGGIGRARRPPGDPPSVILISIDTLRPDHLGCYGHDLPTSPALDAMSRDAVLFTQAIAQAPSTLPSHASILTSLLPQHHGASFAEKTPLPDDVLTLAEVLHRAGYATASFNDGGQLAASLGLGQGFDVYRSSVTDRFARIVNRALRWLDGRPAGPFFLFLHTYEVHHPYTPKLWRLHRLEPVYGGALPDRISVDLLRRINAGEVEIDAADLAHIEAAYDAEIQSMDHDLGRLLDGLRDRGLYRRTLLVFTSDHGEEFGEHGTVGWHSHTLYDELLRVPLLVKLPGSAHAGARVTSQVRSIDLAPTVLGVVGLPVPAAFEGRSLLPLLGGRVHARRYAVSRRDTTASEPEEVSIRAGRFKLDGIRLFDLRADAGERSDVAPLHPEVVRLLADRLAQLTGAKPALPRGPALELDRELRRRLAALGYD